MTIIAINFDGGTALLRSEVWPEGAPDKITAEAVAAAIRHAHAATGGGAAGPAWMLREWGLDDAVRITVVVDGQAVEVWPTP